MLLAFGSHGSAQPQHLSFEHVSVQDGLSQSTVNVIFQDSRGFLWFGTEDGLNRYDGYDFKVFKYDETDSTSLSQNLIWAICEDTQGYLWIGTDGGGVCRYDPETETFTRFAHVEGDSASLNSNIAQTLFVDSQGTLWVGTWGGGLNRYSPVSRSFDHFKYEEGNAHSLSRDQIWTIFEDSRHNLWIGTDGGGVSVLKLQEDTPTRPALRFTHYLTDSTGTQTLPGKSAVTICEDRLGKIWLGTYYSGVFQFDPETETFVQYTHREGQANSLAEDAVWKILEDRQGVLWFGTFSSGLDYLERRNRRFVHVRSNPSDAQSLSADDIRSLYEDRSGVLWVGTMVGGLNKIDRKPPKFFHVQNIPDEPNSLANNFVFTVCEDSKGDVWIGTYGGGLDRYTPKTGRFRHYRHEPNRANSLSSDQVRVIFEDSRNDIWVGTYFGGLNRYVRQTDSFVRYMYHEGEEGGLSHENIRAIFEDRNGVLWVGTNGGGINRFDRKRNRFVAYHPDDVNGEYVLTIDQGPDGLLWVGTYGGGLLKFDLRTQKFTAYKHDVENPSSLSNDVVTEIFFDRKNRMWVGTFGGGLNRFNRADGTARRFSEKDGLGGNLICGILEDDHGFLWVATNRGISRFDPGSETFRNYDASDGLNQDEMNPGAACKGRSGMFYFGGVKGLNFFRPEQVKDNTFIPPVVLTSFEVYGRPVKLRQSLSDLDEITLSYKDRFFSFEFAALDYTNPGKNRYAYKLDGFNEEWIDPGDRRYASYTHLDPGDYVFRVKGSNNDGVWNEEGAAIRITILPPIWQTWWFRILMAGSVLGMLAWTYHRRVSHLKRAKQAQEAFSQQLIETQENERKRIASELHDSIGQDLLIISNGLQQCRSRIPPDDEAAQEIQELSEVTRQSIRGVREIATNLHPHQLERLGLTKAIEAMVNKVRQSTELGIRSELADLDGLVAKEREIDVYRIVQEALNNVIKHSGAGHASIWSAVSPAHKYFEIGVEDDGRGFPVSRTSAGGQAVGFGLKNMNERVKILHGEISIESQPGKGTQLRIRVPVTTTEAGA